MAKFTVDTHLFRELGELLVGRESTALVELLKNSYDADATHVTVHGENLDSPRTGRIIITDNGSGMTRAQFEKGFLRIASRMKEQGDRRSDHYGRRFTGAKGVGRLAAHKPARFLRLESVPRATDFNPVFATIDWDKVESLETLDQIDSAGAVTSEERPRTRGEKHSTIIELRKLRRKWATSERTRLVLEIGSFRAPPVLVTLPAKMVDERILFEELEVNDVRKSDDTHSDPGFTVELSGEFDAGEDYWQTVAQAANWVIEIEAKPGSSNVRYNIVPTKRCQTEIESEGLPKPRRETFDFPHPSPEEGPFFQARIFVREGSLRTPQEQKGWLGQQSGVRIYMEGFRVLPYGEQSDDWLEIDADYTRRERSLRFLDGFGSSSGDEDEGLSQLTKKSYFGGVFLTQEKSGSLRMLVNREGFVPDGCYDTMKKLVRIGIDLSVRRRAAVRLPLRNQRHTERAIAAGERGTEAKKKKELKEAIEESVGKATSFAKEAKSAAARGDLKRAAELIDTAANEFRAGSEINERLLTERGMMRILSGVGLQMAAFVHEINGLLGMAQSIERSFEHLKEDATFNRETRYVIGGMRKSIADLRRIVERQASYLTDITAPDARRKRARLRLHERFESAARLVRPALERRGIQLSVDIPDELRTPPMFPAELTVVLSNLLTNAVKAAGTEGKISVRAREKEGEILFRIENTGAEVNLHEAERWFQPFETTTTKTDPILGQGMGMGLPIARNILEEYGAEIRFVSPSRHYATAVEIRFVGGYE